MASFKLCLVAALATMAVARTVPMDNKQRREYVQPSIVVPQNDCGYRNIEFDTSLNYFQSNDTVWFYDTDDVSNCHEPDQEGTPCKSSMLFTGSYGNYFGHMPFSVWYDFVQVESSWAVTLRYNYNNGHTVIVDTVACDGYEHASRLTKCMFDEELYSYEFFKYYQFTFFATCTFDIETGYIDFNLDHQSETCVDEYNTINTNRFTLASFEKWSVYEVVVVNSDETEFCNNCVPTTTTYEPVTPTEPCETTTEVPVTPTSTHRPPKPTPTPKPCKNCSGDNIANVNVNVNIDQNQ